MAKCNFCGATFGSRQAVRAHLKACGAYKGTEPQAPVPKASVPQAMPKAEPETDRATRLRREVEAEQARLKLREVQAQHRELDERDQERQHRQREAAEAARTAAREAEARQQREQEAKLRAYHRRTIIQNVKHDVLEGWGGLGAAIEGIPEDLRGQALKEIERELSEVAVDELPRSEVVKIAEGIRERVYRPWREQRKAQQQREAVRQERIRHGIDYADGELRKEGDLDFSERWRIRTDVQQLLEGKLTGEETQAEVRGMVGELIRKELAKRGELIMAKTERKVSGFFVCQSCGRAWDLEDESSLKCTCGGILQAADDPCDEEDEDE